MLEIIGSIENVLRSRVEPETLQTQRLGQTPFAFGCGGIATDPTHAGGVLGELAVTPAVAAVLPGDGEYQLHRTSHRTATWYTPFQVGMTGLEKASLSRFGITSETSLSAGAIWDRAIASLPSGDHDAPLYGMIWFGEVQALRGSYLTRPPLKENAPANGLPIGHRENYADWFQIDPDEGGEGLLAMVIGAAFQPDSPGVADLNGMEQRVFYRHPNAPKTEQRLMIHQHALLFEPLKACHIADRLDTTLDSWCSAQQLVDVKHVLDDSTFTLSGGAIKPYYQLVGRDEEA